MFLAAEKLFRIGEVAQMLRLKTSVLRFWETEFPQIAPLRTENGHRMYTEENVALLRRIQQLLHEQGMTIDGARRVLAGGLPVEDELPEILVPIPDPVFMEMLQKELSEIRRLLSTKTE